MESKQRLGRNLGRKLDRLLKVRGWTVYAACQRMPNVGRNSFTRLIQGKADPEKLTYRTVLEIVDTFYPEIKSSDFTRDPELKRFVLARRKITRPSKKGTG